MTEEKEQNLVRSEKLRALKQRVEQLPCLRVGFGGADLESGYQVCPVTVMRHKVLALIDDLLREPEAHD